MKKERKTRSGRSTSSKEPSIGLQQETLRVVYAIASFIIGIFFILSAIGKAGVVGDRTYAALAFLLGIGYFFLPVFLFFTGLIFLGSLRRQHVGWIRLVAFFISLVAFLGIIGIIFKENKTGIGAGGYIGSLIAHPLVQLFDIWASLIFLFGIAFIALIITADSHFGWQQLLFWKKHSEEDADDMETAYIETPSPATAPEAPLLEKKKPERDEIEKEPQKIKPSTNEQKITGLAKSDTNDFAVSSRKFLGKTFTPPPLSLLEEDKGKPGVGDIKANANIIKRTLQNFGINVEMDEISIGPSVTRYALKPAEGVKLSRIVGLQNDLALALAAHPLRIEAPIPGKSLVGIEIPNSSKTTVGLGTLLAGEEFQTSDKPLLVALGRGISGKSHFANLAKMPHLLIAGATGSGKSVTIHAILTSLLYRSSPENLKFIMVDPKRVELTLYNNIPHLLTPVITDPKKAILALKWAAKEMDRRYDILETEKVRDIESYHKNVLGPALKKSSGKSTDQEGQQLPETMPYTVVVIDELADLMQAYPRELEAAIVRLAQMSRAVGIHLIISTQRPSVNVITGLIKANIPSRIALQVTSQIDSRTILDTGGAEKLLGAGDMLYMSGEMAKPQRIQSAFISEKELKDVVGYFIDTYNDIPPSEINFSESAADKNAIFDATFGTEDADDSDPLYEEARESVIQAGKASTSYLQRKLRIGYARAARLIDILEEHGVIGPGEGAKPREILGGGGSVSAHVTEAPENDEVSNENHATMTP